MTATLESRPTDLLEAIRTRRSIGKVSQEAPSKELISELLDAATWAPNHRLTQPWRFFVSTGDARLELGEAMSQAQINAEQPAPEHAAFLREAAAKKVLRAPVILTVAVEPSADPKVPEIEEICATAAATQNILLAAHALDLAAVWRTGDVCSSPEVRALYGLSDRAQVIGFVYLGFPEDGGATKPRKNAAELTTWLGW
ncbi:MAG: nitroreductase [Chloroflexota bacterium]